VPTSSPGREEAAKSILGRARVPTFHNVFAVVSEDNPRINVCAQQSRALNLVWALSDSKEKFLPPTTEVRVVGAGACGLTVAAAAALLGARVRVFDRFEAPMHFQMGCHHRFLHPRIVDWPAAHSVMAGANLPILDWSLGTAAQVRDRIVDQYVRIMGHMKQDTNVTVIPGLDILRDGTMLDWNNEEVAPAQEDAIVVLALGFGVERARASLPRASYWRVDALDQTAIDSTDEERVVLVCGAGDGGITDFLRVTLKSFDQGPFIDRACTLLDDVRSEIEIIEEEASRKWYDIRRKLTDNRGASAAAESDLSKWIYRRYVALAGKSAFAELDKFLRRQLRPRTKVDWMGRAPLGFAFKSQPLLRLLGWRLLHEHPKRFRYEQKDLVDAYPLNQESLGGPKYEVSLAPVRVGPAGYETGAIDDKRRYHQVIVRQGGEPPLARDFPGIATALKARLADPDADHANHRLRQEAFELFAGVLAAAGLNRRGPQTEGLELVTLEHACVAEIGADELKAAIDWERWKERTGVSSDELAGKLRSAERLGKLRCYRVVLCVKWPGTDPDWPNVRWVDYQLHPGNGVITRRASDHLHAADERPRKFALPIFTWDDYEVKAVLSTGEETGAVRLSQLLEKSGHNEEAGSLRDVEALLRGALRVAFETVLRAHAHRERPAPS